MILYHGTNLSIGEIELEKCRPYKDFGKGFYLTEMKEQAIKMAQRVARIYGGIPIINVYEFSDNALKNSEINVLNFGKETSSEWVTFVMNNRNHQYADIKNEASNLDNKYDIVIGPIADDDMAMLFRQYQNAWINFDVLLQGLTFKSSTNQYSFHTLKSLEYLEKVGEIHE